MRKLIAFSVTSCIGLAAFAATAQINRGTKLLGGNMGVNSSTATFTYNDPSLPLSEREREITYRRFSFSPQAGVFVADNLAIGAAIGFTFEKNTSPYLGSGIDTYKQISKRNSLLVAPFVRYYYLPVENFGFYGQLSAGYSFSRIRTTYTTPNPSTERTTGNGMFATITPALVFFPINKLGLELTCGTIGYFRDEGETTGPQRNSISRTYKSSGIGADFGLSRLTLGASYYVGR